MSTVIGQAEWNKGLSFPSLYAGKSYDIQNGWYHGDRYTDNFVLLTIVGFLLFWRDA